MKTHTEKSIRRSGFTTRRGNLGAALAVLATLLSACDGNGSAPDAMVADAGADGKGDGASSPFADGGPALLPASRTCTAAAQCASGFCVDGICCDAACDGSCLSCGLTGKVGTCSPVKSGDDDSCGGQSTCDPTGSCRKKLGSACVDRSECGSGNCVDGVCCASAACGTCLSCAVAGSLGTCAPLAKLTETDDCKETSSCNGLGGCQHKNGSSCSGAADCLSGHCADGFCCNTACDGTCYRCDVSDNEGLCLPIDNDVDDRAISACSGSSFCSAKNNQAPACTSKFKDGEACTTDVQCVNGSCRQFFRDGDGDGYEGTPVSLCVPPSVNPPAGYATVSRDCCDSDPATYPGATTSSFLPNACGKFDRNCDGVITQSAPGACGCSSITTVGGKVVGEGCIRCW